MSRLRLPGWAVPAVKVDAPVRRYSTVGDILSFKRCRRQYGLMGVRGYASTALTQQYFGNLVHDTLDRVQREYRVTGELPGEERLRRVVYELHERLVRAGIHPNTGKDQRETVVTVVSRFVRLVGGAYFGAVRETEFQLERALVTPGGRSFVLSGVVDVLARGAWSALGLGGAPDDVEIWDYKSARLSEETGDTLRDYEFQMLVYAQLYREQHGVFPARCVLVFVSQLGHDARWQARGRELRAHPELLHVVTPAEESVALALADFRAAVDGIEAQRELPYAQQWGVPEHPVNEKTCRACDLRFNCARYAAGEAERARPW